MSPVSHPQPLGATATTDGTTFAVWAPKATTVEVHFPTKPNLILDRDANGTFNGFVPGIGAGERYGFLVDGSGPFPDPYSRYLPDGVHGLAGVIDPSAFAWSDADWRGLTMDRLSIYELHVGTYTSEGTCRALLPHLEELANLGVTAIELMPFSAFPGDRNWGYDGVAPFAPAAPYGPPDDLRSLVDRAHNLGLGVIMDVVYNHLGPEGNYLRVYSDDYFTDRHTTPWGDAVNYDGPGCEFVRRMVLDNVRYWIEEFHIDGLRLDATDTIQDDSSDHILAQIGEAARSVSDRSVVVIAEEARNDVRTVRPRSVGGLGLDAVWADDFHHSLRVHLTGTRERYFADYEGSMPELARAITEGFVYQGQFSEFAGGNRGTTVTDEPASAFLLCIQNHDQIGNRPFGERLHHDIPLDRYAVASALLLFLPHPVLLFMGQEFAASTPFLFFSDFGEDLGHAVTEGRRNEFAGFRAFSDEGLREAIPDPQSPHTKAASTLDLTERKRHAGIYALYKELLRIRNERSFDPRLDRSNIEAQPLGAHTLTVSLHDGPIVRQLIANFGSRIDCPLSGIRDPRILLATSDRRFDGDGAEVRMDSIAVSISVPARTAVILEGIA